MSALFVLTARIDMPKSGQGKNEPRVSARSSRSSPLQAFPYFHAFLLVLWLPFCLRLCVRGLLLAKGNEHPLPSSPTSRVYTLVTGSCDWLKDLKCRQSGGTSCAGSRLTVFPTSWLKCPRDQQKRHWNVAEFTCFDCAVNFVT